MSPNFCIKYSFTHLLFFRDWIIVCFSENGMILDVLSHLLFPVKFVVGENYSSESRMLIFRSYKDIDIVW
jgi:hypothetical protein